MVKNNLNESGSRNHGILLVDDSDVMRRILSELCKKFGFDVVGQAHDGVQAVRLYQTLNPLIVLMDINMPHMDGLEATRLILGINPSAKIVMLSANNERQIVVDAIRAGACSYVVKPVNPAKLIKVLNEIFAMV